MPASRTPVVLSDSRLHLHCGWSLFIFMEVVARPHVGRLSQKYLEGFPITDTFSIQKNPKNITWIIHKENREGAQFA